MSQLTGGICKRLNEANADDQSLFNSEHTVQFLSIKKVTPTTSNTSASVDRYRIIISDGTHFLQAMLATQLNHLVDENAIGKNTIAVIEKLTCNFVQEKRLIIILALRVVQKDAEKIGEPVGAIAPSVAEQNGQNGTAPPIAGPAAATSSTAAPAKQAARAQGKGGRPNSIYPIEGLSPYQNNWTIKARVTQKSEIKTWSNQRGEGKLFNVTLMDESGEIRATGFNAAVDELYDKLEEGKVYFISKAKVNLAKKKFSNLANDYELGLERSSEVEECHETTNVPMVKYSFVTLSGLEEIAKDSTCDIIAVVKEAGPATEFTSKMNKQLLKRELTLVDKSGFSVRMTLWGKQAESWNADDSPIIAVKGARVSDFAGRSLSLSMSSTLTVNPDIEEAHVLRGWYDGFGAQQSFQAHTSTGTGGTQGGFNRAELRNITEVKELQLGMSDKVDYFSTRATVMHIKADNIAYPACPTEKCNKKMTQMNDGWRCEKCDRTFPKPQYRYLISMAVADWSGQMWLQGFNDAGVTVIGRTADELLEIRDRDEAEFNTIIQKANCSTFNFACRAKQDTYNDQTRVRYGIQDVRPIDYHEEAVNLLALLRSPWAQ